jgi:hypothetical protein
MKTKKLICILLGGLLIALVGGCSNEAPEMVDFMLGPPCLTVSFIDSEGWDLVTGIPTTKFVTQTVEYTGDFLSNSTCRTLFVNDEEILSPSMQISLLDKDKFGLPYDAISFIFWDLMTPINDKSNSTIYTVRCEVICPYIFGNDEAHTLTGELSMWYPGGYYLFQKCWFDGVETLPVYYGDVRKENSFIVQVNR